MSIEDEEDASLKDLVTKTLQTNGVLGKTQAQLRASVFLALEEEFRDKNIPLVSQPTQRVLGTEEGPVAASLVQDFSTVLSTDGLDFSLAVLAPESGHPVLWSFLVPEALSTALGLARGKEEKATADKKGQKTPLLIELLRERKTQPLSAREQNGEASSISSDSNSSSREQHMQQPHKQLQDTLRHTPDHLPKAENHLWGKKGVEESQEEDKDMHTPTVLLPLTVENGNKETEVIVGSGKTAGISVSGNASSPRLSNPPSPDESKPDSDTSISGEDKQYEDDFSSMSEKDGPEEEKEEEEEEVKEDIEEDLGDTSVDDLLGSSASGVSDITKDQSLSQASSVPGYQEDL